MSDRAPTGTSTARAGAAAAPTITATAEYLVTGAGFLPDHEVRVRVTYTVEDVSDYLVYRSDSGGFLYAEIPTSPHAGALQVSASDGRSNPDGACGLLWSNVHTVRAASA